MINSKLYSVDIMHYRTAPVKRRFDYRIFLFYVDLDELEHLNNKLWLFSLNRFNYFSFRNTDHLQYTGNNISVKENIINYIRDNGVHEKVGKIMLLTNMATLGYQFNPVSFYFVFDTNHTPLCAVAEVGNTFREMKPYFIGRNHLKNGMFKLRVPKMFYVSPFIDHDIEFDFNLKIPDENLYIRIDDYKGENILLTAVMKGKSKALNNASLFWYAIRFPLITLKVIGLIHWQALKLYLKKVPYHKKESDKHLQVGVYNEYQSH